MIPPIYFQHLPKCGGASIIKAVRPHVLHSNKLTLKYPTSLPPREESSFTHGHGLPLDPFIHDGFWFTVLRHPLDRLLSLYNYIQHKENHYLHSSLAGVPIEDCPHLSDEFCDQMTRLLIPTPYDYHIYTLHNIHYLKKDLSTILRTPITIPHTHITPRTIHHLSPSQEKTLEAYNQKDLDLWERFTTNPLSH